MATTVNPVPVSTTDVSTLSWLKTNASSALASAGETLDKVWSAACEVFATVCRKLGEWLSYAKDALVAAKDRFVELPTETKVVGAVALVATGVLTYLLGKSCSSPAAPATSQAASEEANA